MRYLDLVLEMRKELLEVTPEVSTRVPNPRPAVFIRISSGGGQYLESGHLANATVIIECWGNTYKVASDLAQSAVEQLQSWAEAGDVIEDATITWPVDYPDPESGSDRFTFNVQCFLLPIS